MKALAWTLLIAFYLTCIYGYVANLVKLVGLLGGELTALFLTRLLGAVVPPIGTFMGFL